MYSTYDDSWRQTQDLAYRGRYAKDKAIVFLNESLRTADQCSDAYQRVAVKAWPFRALLELGLQAEVLKHVKLLLSDARTLENPVRRMDALFLVYEAVADSAAEPPVLTACIETFTSTLHWKPSYLAVSLVSIVGHRDPKRALEIANQIPQGRYRRQAIKRTEACIFTKARRFFYGAEDSAKPGKRARR